MLRSIILVSAVCLFFLSGCGGVEPNPKRHNISGKVELDGAPVAAGRIYFSPNVKENNSGPQGFAPINQGKYDTSQGKGPPSGALIIRIEAFDGNKSEGNPMGAVVFTYEGTAQIGADEKTKDFALKKEEVEIPDPNEKREQP